MSKTATCRISVSLNITFNSLTDTKKSRHYNFQRVWTELLIKKCFLRQSLTKYVETSLRNQVKYTFMKRLRH